MRTLLPALLGVGLVVGLAGCHCGCHDTARPSPGEESSTEAVSTEAPPPEACCERECCEPPSRESLLQGKRQVAAEPETREQD